MVNFTDNNIIERTEYSGIPFNTKITYPENCEVVVITEGSARRLKKLDGGVINPKTMHLFSKKTDSRTHTIYYIDNAYHDARWGGNVEYEDSKVNCIQEKVFIRASFSFKIDKGDRFIELLSETQKKYTKRYVVDKIRGMMDNVFKAYISKSLNEIGYIKSQENIMNISESAMNKLNSDVLLNHGVMISNLNLVLEEDTEHAMQRNELAWNKLKKEKENN